jgi:protein-tyrosine phosphatase
MSLSSLEYQILEDCKADLEDFSALVSSIDYGSLEELRKLVAALTGLVNKNLLTCCRGVDRSAAIEVDVLLLPQYLSARKAAGEDLAAYPAVSRELSFMATDSGLEALRKEDRPLDKTED